MVRLVPGGLRVSPWSQAIPPQPSQQRNIVQPFPQPSLAGARFSQPKRKWNLHRRPHFAPYQDFQQNLETLGFEPDVSDTRPPHQKESRHGILDANFRLLQRLGQPDRQPRQSASRQIPVPQTSRRGIAAGQGQIGSPLDGLPQLRQNLGGVLQVSI